MTIQVWNEPLGSLGQTVSASSSANEVIQKDRFGLGGRVFRATTVGPDIASAFRVVNKIVVSVVSNACATFVTKIPIDKRAKSYILPPRFKSEVTAASSRSFTDPVETTKTLAAVRTSSRRFDPADRSVPTQHTAHSIRPALRPWVYKCALDSGRERSPDFLIYLSGSNPL
jgi:hypothetical protein